MSQHEGTGFDTRCVHGGDHRNRSGQVTTPIHLSTTFEFPDTSEGARRAADIAADEFYGRWGSVNAREFEALIAALEGTDDAVCAGSGLAAIAMVLLAFLNPGDHFIGVHACYSETKILHESLARQLGVDATFVDPSDVGNFASAMRSNTKLVYAETPANPTLTLVDIEAVAKVVHEHPGCVFVVDSTFATPYNQTPLSRGADIVVHSATKYIGGHSDVVAGVCAGPGALMERVRKKFSFHGPHLDPFAAWLLCRGVKTLGLRMEKHNCNASRLARWLEAQPAVSRVYYPMLDSHPQHDLAKRQLSAGGGMICFEVAGGREAALDLVSNVRLCTLAVSLGGAHSLITHPASMTHNLLSDKELERAGITGGMIRFSVGLESAEDIERDLMEALQCIGCSAAPGALEGTAGARADSSRVDGERVAASHE
jgi:methionine-gamma-lyase